MKNKPKEQQEAIADQVLTTQGCTGGGTRACSRSPSGGSKRVKEAKATSTNNTCSTNIKINKKEKWLSTQIIVV